MTLAYSDVRLLDAVEQGDLETLRGIIDADPVIVGRFREGGMTLLHVAAREGQAKVVRLLLDKGADVDAKVEGDWGGRGETPLFYAAGSGDIEAVVVLVEHGADVDVQNERGKKAADVARVNGHEDIARYLEAEGSRGRSLH